MDPGDRKRKPEEADGDGLAKKPRLEPNGAANGEAADAPAPKLSAIERAKLALSKKKELEEKLARLRTQQAAVAAAVPKAKPTTAHPPPLVVDDQGRELRADGTAIPLPSTAPPKPKPARLDLNPDFVYIEEEFFDHSLGARGMKRLNRKARPEMRFVDEGEFQKAAEITRLKAKYGDKYVYELAERRAREQEMAADNLDVNAIPLGSRAPAEEPEEPIPDVEWWDTKILLDKSTYGPALDGADVPLRQERITFLVEHPIQVEPALEAPPPPPQPLKLTKKEMKKLRTQRRLAREQEKQDLIRQGLLEPPKPKVKISNLMRVLGSEAAADPTAIEREVQKQMAERMAAHQDRNLANMLTPAEKREKKLRKIMDAQGAETQVGVYKIKDLSKPQLKFKVEMNARENHMTGVVVMAREFTLVVVEGGPKTLRRYDKLMTERIQWNKQDDDDDADAMDNDTNDNAMDTDSVKEPNYCYKVWSGTVKAPSFKRFKTEVVPTLASGRQVLVDAGVGHYWDAAVEHTVE